MPPKKEAKKGLYRPGTPLKDIIPPTLKQPPREGKPPRIPEYTASSNIINPYEPQPEFEEWPGDEAALAFDFGLDAPPGKLYNDPAKLSLPPSFKMKENYMIFWRRPKELVKTEIDDHHISYSSVLGADNRFSRQNTMPGELEGRSSIHIADDGNSDGPELQMFEVAEREETPEEVELRVKELTEKQQQQQGKKKPGKKDEPIDTNPQKIKDIKLGNISMKDDIPAYAKWIASQLQIIKDRNIRDAIVRRIFE